MLWPTESEANLLGQGKLQVTLPVVKELLTINGTSDITFQDIALLHTDYELGRTQMADGQGTVWQRNAGVHITFSTNISLVRCSIRHHGSSAVWVDRGSHYVILTGNDITELGSGGVRIGYDDNAFPVVSGGDDSCSGTITNNPGGPQSGLGVSNVNVSNCRITNGGCETCHSLLALF